MKTNFFISCMCLCFCCSVPSLSQKMYLKKVFCSYDSHSYTYTSKDKVESYEWVNPEYNIKSKYTYDESNQCIRTDDYQLMNTDEWLHSAYLLYTYDEHGNLLTRANYNYDPSSENLVQNGLITYTYNEKDQLVSELTEIIMSKKNVPMYKRFYTYNEKGQLDHIAAENNDNLFGGDEPEWLKSELEEFVYDEIGNIVIDSIRYYDPETEEPTDLSSKQEYFYDENNNLILHNYYTPGSTVNWVLQEYQEYEYDLTKLAKDYVYPIEPELTWPYLKGLTHERTKEIQYVRDNNTGEIGYFDTYEYVYETYGSASIRNVQLSDKALIYPNPVKESFTLNLSDKNCPVYIYDMEGKLIISFSKAEGTLDVSDLATGTYLLKCGKYASKLIKK